MSEYAEPQAEELKRGGDALEGALTAGQSDAKRTEEPKATQPQPGMGSTEEKSYGK